jgi:hypothetical protein
MSNYISQDIILFVEQFIDANAINSGEETVRNK